MPALVREREPIATLPRRVLFWVKALVDDDAAFIEDHRTEDVRSRPERGTPNKRCVSSNSIPSFRCFSIISSIGIGAALITPRPYAYSARRAAASRSI
jgi:hypothetical protein